MRWRGESVCILASGPSLTEADASYARKHLDRVIAVNESWRRCPTADVLYGADSAWWLHRGPSAETFKGERWTQDKQWRVEKPHGLQTMPSKPGNTIAPPGSDFIYTGHNSSFQAMGLAILWGAIKIVFLGLDLSCAPDGQNHWHGEHPEPLVNSRQAYPAFKAAFEAVVPKLSALGVSVINASRVSALEAYPRMSIEDACR